MEGPNGFMSRLTMRQFWAWMEFDRLNPFMQERDDWRIGQVASAVYNVNIIDKEKMTTAGDFTYPSMDDILKQEIEVEAQTSELSEEERKARIEAWNQRVANLTAGRRSVQTEIRG